MKDLITVAKFTMMDMLQRKSFIISMIIILGLIVIGFNIPNIIDKIQGDSDSRHQILIIDKENIFEGYIDSLNTEESDYVFMVSNDIEKEDIKNKIDNNEIDTCLEFNKNENEIIITYYIESVLSYGELPEEVINIFATLYQNIQLTKIGLSDEELQQIKIPFSVQTIETDENAATGNPFVIMISSIILFYAIYFCAYQVSSSITTEKTSRIMETLITSASPKTIVIGKTIGIGIVGLLQVISILIVGAISAKIFLPEQMLNNLLDMANITPVLIISIIIYFILGYFLYAFLYALTGSTVSKPEDINSANSPIAIITIIAFYLAYFSMMNPSSKINVIASILPISSPFSMPFRVMMETATAKELIGSLIILLTSIILVAKISIKIYSSAILNYGTKLNIKDMVKIFKRK